MPSARPAEHVPDQALLNLWALYGYELWMLTGATVGLNKVGEKGAAILGLLTWPLELWIRVMTDRSTFVPTPPQKYAKLPTMPPPFGAGGRRRHHK